MNESAYIAGQNDCKNGIPHQDRGDDYNRGYAAQYEWEQVKAEVLRERRD